MDSQIQIVSIQVGLPRQHGHAGAEDPMDRPWRTAFFKDPVSGPVHVLEERLEGDGQADRRFHGGFDKAILAYAESHYAYWRADLAMPALPYGAFAENLTIAGQDESTVCVGDIYEMDDNVVVQVSQPRQPCGNISRRWKIRDLTSRVKANGRTGWYLRVLQTGTIEAGTPIRLAERPFPQWTIELANKINNNRRKNPEAARELAACPALSHDWREMLGEPG